jgi:uncharacterized protein YdeI (YjbR/CyaY-like superfamily)
MVKEPANAIHPKTRQELRDWLMMYHAQSAGVWLISYKKASNKPRLSYDEIVEELLAFGWIDSKPNKLDSERSLLWIAPRKAKTGWSKINKDRVSALTRAGRMSAPGLAKVAAAQQDGSWNALDEIEALIIPDDLQHAFSAYPDAERNFNAFPRSVKRGILEWIATAKRSETRVKRIEETARLASVNQRANQWRK